MHYLCGTIMKIEYAIPRLFPKTNINNWLQEMDLEISKVINKNKTDTNSVDYIHQHYQELIEEFKDFLNSSELILDSTGNH